MLTINNCVMCFPPLPTADYNTSEQKQACRKHELYVSFRDLGWQVEMIFHFLFSSFSFSSSTNLPFGLGKVMQRAGKDKKEEEK